MTAIKKLKEAVEKSGYRLQYVAEKSGIAYTSLVHYLNGTRPIPDHRVVAICKVINSDPKKFGIDDNKKCRGSV